MTSYAKETQKPGGEPERMVCSGVWGSTLSFVVDQKGAIAGQATGKLITGGSCPNVRYNAGFPQIDEITFSITGTATPKQLNPQLTPVGVKPAGGADWTGLSASIAPLGKPAVFTVPITSPTEARRENPLRYQPDQANLYTTDNKISLVCNGC